MSCWFSSIAALLAALTILLLFNSAETEAKRGCATFGHSCYGGMGKRTSELLDTNEEIVQDVQGEENPAFVFTGPRSEYKPERLQRLTPQQYDSLSRIVKQWIQSYRRSQDIQGNNI